MKRLAIASLIFFLAFIAILVRLFYWQIINGKALAADAQNQYASQYSIFPNRGRILAIDRAPLVTNEQAYLLFAQPKKLPKDPAYLDKLAEILEVDEASITARLNFKKQWVALQHYVAEEKKNKIDKLKFEGIGFEEESKRFYPEGSSSAHLLGFVGQNVSGKPTGYFGLEGYYDEILGGKSGFVRQEKDALGFIIPIGKRSEVEPVDGANLILNIDKSIQNIVEEKLKEGIKKYGARGGGVVVMRPDTGAVLAMISFPSYDPAKFTEYDTSLYKNPLIADTYEPGSTFKVLIMAAAINEKKVKPDTTYNEDGPVKVQGYTIRTWNNKYGGKTNMVQVLERSSNVGMVFVSTKLEKDLFYKYLKEYGFGQKTGIDLQEEVSSSLRKKNDWKTIDLATASFGQGIAVTPIQLIRAIGSIANGGLLITPQVAAGMIQGSDKLIKFENKPPKRVLSETTAAILSEMMVSAVDNGGAKWAKPKGFRIAGKTGTAQIPIKGHYDTEKTIASFIGFAPVENPSFIMLVVLREPTTSPWGSETAAPLFFNIARDLFAYLNIYPR